MTDRTPKTDNRRKEALKSITPPPLPASIAFVRFMAGVLAERDDALSVKADSKAHITKTDRSAQ